LSGKKKISKSVTKKSVDYLLAYQRFGLLEGKFCTMDFRDEVDGDYFGF